VSCRRGLFNVSTLPIGRTDADYLDAFSELVEGNSFFALIKYVATWRGAVFEFRKQHVAIHTIPSE
jgi:hypothetical protein